MGNLIILQTAAPDYRKKFFSLLRKEYNGDFKLFAGDNYFQISVKTDYSIPNLTKINNHYFFGRKITFQAGMWREVLKTDNLVLEMNPRIISNWVILLVRKLMFKPTVLWGHAWSKGGQNSSPDKLRQLMRMLASQIICYTKTQAEELQLHMPRKKISYASNAVYSRSEMVALDVPVGNNIIYVGRLIKEKKPDIAIRAFQIALPHLPQDSKLIIVGEGGEKQHLQDLIKELALEGRVELLGHIAEYEALQELYSQALVSISPGYVGLSITQSFGFGVPMIISRNEVHSPEIECVSENENAVFFETDDIKDFSKKIIDAVQNKTYWAGQRLKIIETTREKYSIENMIKPFILLGE
jgi:glycosyltransferase involved in cell wall biosynthesis